VIGRRKGSVPEVRIIILVPSRAASAVVRRGGELKDLPMSSVTSGLAVIFPQ
jgi:hypothetical protein